MLAQCQGDAACSKGEAERLLRKLIVLRLLVEETFRQDNQYQSVSSALRVNDPVAARLASGELIPWYTAVGMQPPQCGKCCLAGSCLFTEASNRQRLTTLLVEHRLCCLNICDIWPDTSLGNLLLRKHDCLLPDAKDARWAGLCILHCDKPLHGLPLYQSTMTGNLQILKHS